MAKIGRLSAEEKKYIEDNASLLTPEKIAEAIDRTPEMVQRYIREKVGLRPDTTPAEQVVRQSFRRSAEWAQLPRQFTPDEIRFFEDRYATWMAQFKDDFTPSEQTQVFRLIKIEILMNRNLEDKQRSVIDMGNMEKELNLLRDIDPKSRTDEDKRLMASLSDNLAACRAAQQSRTNEYIKLEEKAAALMKELKATRDQRLARIENAKTTVLDIIKELLDEEKRNVAGRQYSLVGLAAQKEKNRLSQLHKYADGGIDRPILSAESVQETNDAVESSPD